MTWKVEQVLRLEHGSVISRIALLGIYDKQTNQPTNQNKRTDMTGHLAKLLYCKFKCRSIL